MPGRKKRTNIARKSWKVLYNRREEGGEKVVLLVRDNCLRGMKGYLFVATHLELVRAEADDAIFN